MPAKSRLKTTLQRIPNLRLSGIPLINNEYSYDTWLASIMNRAFNRKIIRGAEKEQVDKCRQAQAARQFQHDQKKYDRALAEVGGEHCIIYLKDWAKMHCRSGGPPAKQPGLSGNVIRKTQQFLKQYPDKMLPVFHFQKSQKTIEVL